MKIIRKLMLLTPFLLSAAPATPAASVSSFVHRLSLTKSANISFTEDSWENVISNVNNANQGISKLNEVYGVDTFVGLERKVVINNHVHTVKVIDENHDTCTETGQKAALTFQLTTLLSDENGNAIKTIWDTGNNYNYTHGYLKGNLTGNGGKQSWEKTAWDMLPAELKSGIKKVNKNIWEWNSEGEDGHYVDYSDYLFALTCTEYAQTNKDEEYHTEGTPYKYWVDNNYNPPNWWDTDYHAIKRMFKDANENECNYWLATPYTIHYEAQSYDEAWYVFHDGGIHYQNTEVSIGVSFAFCI